MRFTRRKALASIGAVGIGGSAVFGSGAFTQTAADRDFDLQVAADDNALLGLEPVDTDEYGGTDAVDVSAVSGDGRDLLEFDFTDDSLDGGVNNQADTAFDDAFRVTNNSSQSVWVWIPGGDEEASLDASRGGLLGSGNRSTEFVVDDPDDAEDYEGDSDAVDLSFPFGIPKNPDDLSDEEFDDDELEESDYGGADSQSRAFGMTPGGAVELGASDSVEVNVIFLIVGSNDPFTDEAQIRFRADRTQPEPEDWEDTFIQN